MAHPLATTIAATLLCGACAMPQQAEIYRYQDRDQDDGRFFAHADRYAGNARNPVDLLEIDLAPSPPFRVRLPEGGWLDSRTITAERLRDAGFEFYKLGARSLAVWAKNVPLIGSLMGRHRSMDFELDSDGRAVHLSLSACGYVFEQVLAPADGDRAFDFPIPVPDLLILLGTPTRIERFDLITGFSCL